MPLEDYEVVKVVGKGSFGDACLVKEKKTNGEYVMKQVAPMNLPQAQRSATVAEIEVLAKVKHAYIVAYHDSFEQDSLIYIIMEYCSGGDLGARLRQQIPMGPFPEQLLWDWFTQVVLAMAFVHSMKILHRDIKMENIFLTGDDVVKLGDFGIARALDSTMATAQTAIGTLYYLSPEICSGRNYNSKSDVWALGVLLYKLITFNFPFDASSVPSMARKIVKGKYRKLPKSVSPELVGVVSALLQQEPGDRPSLVQLLERPEFKDHKEKWAPSSPKVSRESSSASLTTSTDSTSESSSGEVVGRMRMYPPAGRLGTSAPHHKLSSPSFPARSAIRRTTDMGDSATNAAAAAMAVRANRSSPNVSAMPRSLATKDRLSTSDMGLNTSSKGPANLSPMFSASQDVQGYTHRTEPEPFLGKEKTVIQRVRFPVGHAADLFSLRLEYLRRRSLYREQHRGGVWADLALLDADGL